MKIIIEKTERVAPIKKGLCPECHTKMTKLKKEWVCLKCGTRVNYK